MTSELLFNSVIPPKNFYTPKTNYAPACRNSIAVNQRRTNGTEKGRAIPPRCPKICFLQKSHQIPIFLPRTLLGRLTVAIQGSGVPQEEYPQLQDNFLATRSLYAINKRRHGVLNHVAMHNTNCVNCTTMQTARSSELCTRDPTPRSTHPGSG